MGRQKRKIAVHMCLVHICVASLNSNVLAPYGMFSRPYGGVTLIRPTRLLVAWTNRLRRFRGFDVIERPGKSPTEVFWDIETGR